MTQDEMTDCLVSWCAIPSHAGATAGQAQMVNELSHSFGRLADGVRREPVGPGSIDVFRAWSPTRAGQTVLLVGHYDTVPHDGGADEPSVVIDGDRLIARGSADMKGGLVVMLEALGLVERQSRRAPAWEVMIVPDEEIGSPWSRDLLLEAAGRCGVALVLEPAPPSGGLVRGRKGAGTLEVEIIGRAAHAGRNPQEGRSAIAALAEMIVAIEATEDPALGTQVNVTTVEGGSAPNVVPGAACAQVDVRADHPNEATRVIAELEARTREIAFRRGVDVSLTGGMNRPPKPVDAATEALFGLYRDGAAKRGVDIGWEDVGGASDANLIAPAGIPILDGLGVRGGDLHGHGEYAVIDSLPERAGLLADLLMTLAE